ncbi:MULTISPECIES: hypothetical protein [unclassified Microcoleus]|uniref:hypothetical protein n=1 Tax=unclassified Microcoleus TaxID=2642155 RepID=UPI002FD3585D
MSADFEVEIVFSGKVLLTTQNLPLVIELLTTATAILARSCALSGRSRLIQFYFCRSRDRQL